MNELYQYDLAAQEFYGRLSLSNFPIASMDFYGMRYDTLAKGGRDLTVIRNLATANRWHAHLDLEHELLQNEHVIVITDTELKIVHATQNIIAMNGYEAQELVGKSPKMFQGSGTCEKTSKYISQAVRDKVGFEAIVLNYRKDGSPYKCWIKGEPVKNEDGKVVHFIAYEREVA